MQNTIEIPDPSRPSSQLPHLSAGSAPRGGAWNCSRGDRSQLAALSGAPPLLRFRGLGLGEGAQECQGSVVAQQTLLLWKS